MKATFNADRSAITITADIDEQTELRTLRMEEPEEWATTAAECEALESLLANSELQWIDPANTGDLTDAPMLGITGEEQREESGPYGAIHTGGDEHGPRFSPILERWAFMPYALRSFLEDLADTGEATFTNHA